MSNFFKIATSNEEHDEQDEEAEYSPPTAIFTPSTLGEPVPQGYDAVRIALDGKIMGDLNWKAQCEFAERYSRQSMKIFWEIDLGIFDNLSEPLANKKQFLALSLSLEHFRDAIWPAFRHHTAGLCLYHGPADFFPFLHWDDQQTANLQEWLKVLFQTIEAFHSETLLSASSFRSITETSLQVNPTVQRILSFFCAQACSEYLDLLSASLPDNLPLFLDLDASNSSDPFTRAQLLSQELYPRFHLITNPSPPLSTIGICIPPISQCLPSTTDPLISFLSSIDAPYRTIPESLLTSQWDGLDQLFVLRNPSSYLQRKLNGFTAAGGTIEFL